MAFLSFPFMFEEEEEDNLGISTEKKLRYTVINTYCIVCYSDLGEKTRVKMADGTNYDMPIIIDDFENILMESENIIDIEAPSLN